MKLGEESKQTCSLRGAKSGLARLHCVLCLPQQVILSAPLSHLHCTDSEWVDTLQLSLIIFSLLQFGTETRELFCSFPRPSWPSVEKTPPQIYSKQVLSHLF